MLSINKILLLSLFLVFLLPTTEAIGLLTPDIGRIIYRPGYEAEFPFYVVNYNYDFEAYASGQLSDYITVGPVTNASPGMKQFSLKVKFPNEITLDPGVYLTNVGVKEVGSPGGMVGALVGVQTRIRVEVLSNEKVLRAEFDAPDANEKEIMTFRIDLESATYQDISLVIGRITVYDLNNNSLATFDTNKVSLASGEEKTIEADWNNSILIPGEYRADALIIYDGESMSLEDDFRVGTLMIKILNYTEEFISGEVNEFKMEVENVWNSPVKDIYAELIIDNEPVLKTATINLNSWQKGSISQYWNVTLEPGEYNAKIRLYYAGTYTEKNIKIQVNEPKVRLSTEQIYGLIIVVLIILVIILGIVLTRMYSKQKDHKEEKAPKFSKAKKRKARKK